MTPPQWVVVSNHVMWTERVQQAPLTSPPGQERVDKTPQQQSSDLSSHRQHSI
jgi:hypothetical protein